jgi:hypothetical protein
LTANILSSAVYSCFGIFFIFPLSSSQVNVNTTSPLEDEISGEAQMNELLKSNCHNGRQVPFYHFHNKDQREVNALVEHDGILHPVKCKNTALPSHDTLAGVSALEWLGAAVGAGCAHLYGVGLAAVESQTFTAVPAGVL